MFIIIVIIMITIIILTLKGAVRDFYNLLTAPRIVSNTYAQVTRTQSYADYVQHIESSPRANMSCAEWWVLRDSSAVRFDRVT